MNPRGRSSLPAWLSLGLAFSTTVRAEVDLDALASAMTGSFSSAAQAAEDPRYFDIRLQVVPIWTSRSDGPWLYVEQSVAETQGRPYRQRVYHLAPRGDQVIESEVYLLPYPDRYVGAWREPSRFAELQVEQLELRRGCGVFLSPGGAGTYSGSTDGRGCASDLNGASYATSEVTVFPDRLISWDRGYDADDRQVWGTVSGGYVFLAATAPAVAETP